jgi:hypothetical protein
MAFINEKLSERDKARIDWSPYLVYLNRRVPFDPFMWTIDRGRDVFLMWIGKRHPGPHLGPVWFGLNWKGTVIRFLANVSYKTDPGTRSDIYWDIELPIPERLVAEQEEVLTVLEEAIQSHGYQYSGPSALRKSHISIREKKTVTA